MAVIFFNTVKCIWYDKFSQPYPLHKKRDFVQTWYKRSLRAIKTFAKKKSVSVGGHFLQFLLVALTYITHDQILLSATYSIHV